MIWLGYGALALFVAAIIWYLERYGRRSESFSDYATAGRSFGPWFSTMAFLNTWLPGTVFVSFAGYTAGAGVVGFYSLPYALVAVLLMFFLAKPVHTWGKRFDLRTQADLLGLRYGSKTVRVIAAVIGVLASFPWLVLGFQSLTYVFTYLSFGRVGASAAVFIGIAVIVVRQIWTIRLGTRGLVMGDMIQGIVAYGVGTLAAVGMFVWLLTNGHGLSGLDSSFFTVPGPGSSVGGLYYFSIVITGALGGWSWPDIFVRLFSSKDTATLQKSAARAAPILLIFSLAISLMALAASSLPDVASAPDAVWFTTAAKLGPLVLTVAGVCVLAATMGNVGANLQALGVQTANDIVSPARGERPQSPRVAQVAVAALLVLASIGAWMTAHTNSGLVTLAQMSYQGIVQLAPTLFLGIFWRRGTALAAASSMIIGFAVAAGLEWYFPNSIPALGGLTSGVVGLVVNCAVYLAVSYLRPATSLERTRVDRLFAALDAPTGTTSSPSTKEIAAQ